MASDNANVLQFDPDVQSSVLSLESANNEANSETDPDDFVDTNLISCIEDPKCSYFKENILYYICGFIVRKARNSISCPDCLQLLISEHDDSSKTFLHFIKTVNRGNLMLVSKDVLDVVLVLDHNLKTMSTPVTKSAVNKIVLMACKNLGGKVFANHPIVEEWGEESHPSKLIKLISFMFIKIKLHDLAKKATNKALTTPGMRQKLSKLILFNHV